MSTPIPYTIQKGDTLGKIAEKLKINNWKDLQVYHNNNCPLKEQIGTNLKEGNTLYTPPKDEIAEMNGGSKEKTQPESEKKEEKTQEGKPKEEKKKDEKKEDSKSEHDGKYYVVHGGTCVCDKAEDPTKEAELQVATHQKMIYNDQAKKYAATEDDKQFNPPAATFGKCTLKPSSSGYLPCALAPAPKWDKPYDKTKVMGKCVLTEISELKCMVGGKITVKKHGQTDAATTAHAQNTNPAEMAHANPAVKKPITKTEYPSVDYITIESIENRTKFKPVKSKEEKTVEKIYVRPDENCNFTANINKGNKSLTSWVIYEGFEGKSDQKLLTKEQIGTSFSNSFPAIGNYRVEGYGKPKKTEFENGEYDKNYPSCSIDIIVAINKLDENKLELYGEDFASKIKDEFRLRKDFPAAFKAKFLMTPTEEELSRLEMFVTDEAGNRLTNYQQEGKILNFTPNNGDAVYNFHAIYTDEEGKTWEQRFKGKTLTKNYVVSISHTDQVVREFSPVGFEVKQMKIGSLIAADQDLTEGEIQDIKWDLNGVYQNSGRVLSIPKGLALGNYVAEAYCSMSNGFGVKAKKEEDDWHFEVKRNDVVDIQADSVLKVGKKALFTASSFVFKDLSPNEKVNWTLNGQSVPNTIAIKSTPSSPGNVTVTAKINVEKGITKNFTVVQPVLENMMFTDSNGIEIQKSAWGNKVHIWLKEKYLTGEKLKVALYDKGTPVYYFPEKVYDGGLLDLELNDELRKHTKDYAELKVMVNSVDLNFPKEGELMGMLEVGFARGVYSGQIGSEDGRQRHSPVDYDMVSWFYAKSRGIKETEKVTIEIWEYNMIFDEKLLTGVVSPDKSGAIKLKIDWSKIPKGKQGKYKNIYVKVLDNTNKNEELYNGNSLFVKNFTPLYAKSEVNKLAGYSSAAIVGSSQLSQNPNGSSCYCKTSNLLWGDKFNCQERKKVIQICKNLWPAKNEIEMANHLMVCMAIETGEEFSPSTGYKSGGATGLVQWTGTALDGMNKNNKYNKGSELTKKKLAGMTVLEQLDYVELYFKMWIDSGKIIKDSLDMYMCIWCPAAVGKEESFVCYTKAKDEEIKKNNPDTKYQPYTGNSGIDGEYYDEKSQELLKGKKDGEITKGELKPRLRLKEVVGQSFKVKYYNCGGKDNNVPLEIEDIITYKVFSDGNIEKHIPKKIREDVKDKYKYVYVDKNKKEHNICIVDFFETDKRENGSKIDEIPSGYKSTYKYPKGGNAQTAYVYENGDICVEGTKYGYRKYPKGQGKVLLVRMKDSLSYENGDVKVFYKFAGSQRRYCNPEAYAGFIGALVMIDRKDVQSTGMCFADATSYPSVTHPNGDSADTMYFATLAEEQLKVNAFKFYHFEHIHRGSGGWFPQLTGTTYVSGHEDHLHSGDFITSILKVIKD